MKARLALSGGQTSSMIQHHLQRVGSSWRLQHGMLDHLVKQPKPTMNMQSILGGLLSKLAVTSEKRTAGLRC